LVKDEGGTVKPDNADGGTSFHQTA
jgi:hypothetical protein